MDEKLPAPVRAVDLARRVIGRHQRPDLDERLARARERLLADHVRVLVVGEFKQGKSFLVNALVSAPASPVHDDLATSVPTVVRHAEDVVVTVVSQGEPDVHGHVVEHRRALPGVGVGEIADRIAEQVLEGSPDPGRRRVGHVEVGLPRAILSGGLEIVDTPGVGGLNSVHGAATLAALPSADAVVLVSDASQEYTAPELEFLRRAIGLCPNVVCVLTKTDLYPEWRRVAELDRAHLRAAGIDTEIFAVSSAVRWQAVIGGDPALNDESGFPALEHYLHDRVVGDAGLLARRSTVHDVSAVSEQIVDGLVAEQLACEDPSTVGDLIARLTDAQQQAAALKERSARWQHTLNDGVTDLNADIDHDLRDRMREIVRLAEDEINDGGDPMKTWDQITLWVEQQTAAAASANFVWATQRARWLSGQVASHFSEDEEQILPHLRAEASGALGTVRGMSLREGEPWGLGTRSLTALRGGYIGVLMFGLMGTLVGMSLINPFSVGAGILLGGKAISEERRRIYARRQSDAKVAVRRYIDDVTFQVGKESRDMLRGVQRDLRDHFTEQAEELNQSLKVSIQNAEKSLRTTKADRERRLTEIPTEIQRLEKLRERVRTLLPAAERAGLPAAAPAVVESAPDEVLVRAEVR